MAVPPSPLGPRATAGFKPEAPGPQRGRDRPRSVAARRHDRIGTAALFPDGVSGVRREARVPGRQLRRRAQVGRRGRRGARICATSSWRRGRQQRGSGKRRSDHLYDERHRRAGRRAGRRPHRRARPRGRARRHPLNDPNRRRDHRERRGDLRPHLLRAGRVVRPARVRAVGLGRPGTGRSDPRPPRHAVRGSAAVGPCHGGRPCRRGGGRHRGRDPAFTAMRDALPVLLETFGDADLRRSGRHHRPRHHLTLGQVSHRCHRRELGAPNPPHPCAAGDGAEPAWAAGGGQAHESGGAGDLLTGGIGNDVPDVCGGPRRRPGCGPAARCENHGYGQRNVPGRRAHLSWVGGGNRFAQCPKLPTQSRHRL